MPKNLRGKEEGANLVGHVITIHSVSKVALSDTLAEMDMATFTKALAVVKRLHGSTAGERVRTLQNWLDAEMITAAECSATLDFYEYRRGK